VNIPRVLEEKLLHPGQANLHYGDRTGLQEPRVQLPHQRFGADLAGDEDLIPLPRLD